jgi:hypothetical protein
MESDLRQSNSWGIVEFGGHVLQRKFTAFYDGEDARMSEAREVNNLIADEHTRCRDIAAEDG